MVTHSQDFLRMRKEVAEKQKKPQSYFTLWSAKMEREKEKESENRKKKKRGFLRGEGRVIIMASNY